MYIILHMYIYYCILWYKYGNSSTSVIFHHVHTSNRIGSLGRMLIGWFVIPPKCSDSSSRDRAWHWSASLNRSKDENGTVRLFNILFHSNQLISLRIIIYFSYLCYVELFVFPLRNVMLFINVYKRSQLQINTWYKTYKTYFLVWLNYLVLIADGRLRWNLYSLDCRLINDNTWDVK